MRTNLNGCFVAFTLGTPLFVTTRCAEDRVLCHVFTTSKDYDKIPFFFFLPFPSGWAGFNAQFFLPPPPNSEKILQTGIRVSDNTLDGLWHHKCGIKLCFVAENRNEVL